MASATTHQRSDGQTAYGGNIGLRATSIAL